MDSSKGYKVDALDALMLHGDFSKPLLLRAGLGMAAGLCDTSFVHNRVSTGFLLGRI